MSDTPSLNRRQLLVAGAALPAAAAVPGVALAKSDMKGASSASINRFVLGDFEVTTMLAGSRSFDGPHGIFGQNVSEEEFKAVSEANFLPTDVVQFYFNPTVVNTGAELVLFDTGLNPDAIVGVLGEAGYAPEDIDVVVITHMHGDHIGGLMGDAGATFPNARYVTGETEFDHWAGAENDTFDGKMRPLAEKTGFIKDGGSVARGVTAVSAFGHTPGHMNYMIESGGKQVLLTADTANHYVWSLAYPDWEVRFDMDKAGAAAARGKILGMLAADKIPFIGYHMPFPGVGYVEQRGEGFRYVPVSYQLQL